MRCAYAARMTDDPNDDTPLPDTRPDWVRDLLARGTPLKLQPYPSHMQHMTTRQKLFVEEYLRDFNGRAAARRAGLSGNGYELGPKIRHAIGEELKHRIDNVEEGVPKTGEVLRELVSIAMANPNDLTQYQIQSCRYCHGEGHLYQYTTPRALEAAMAAHGGDKPFPPHGGTGFDPRIAPNPDCPECFGQGDGRLQVNDTRMLKGAARALYAGVKQTKDGIEVKMHDKVKALELLARHLGLMKDSLDLSNTDGTLKPVDSDESVAKLAAILATARERKALAKAAEDFSDLV